MFRKATPCGERDGLPAGNDAFSGLRSVFQRFANVRLEDARVHAELLRAVYAAAPAVLTANLVNGALVVLVFWSVVPPRLLIGWYALLCAVVGIRTWLWSRHRRERPPPSKPIVGGGSPLSVQVRAGRSGARLVRCFLCPTRPIHEIVLAFVLGGMGAGATVSLPPTCRLLLPISSRRSCLSRFGSQPWAMPSILRWREWC